MQKAIFALFLVCSVAADGESNEDKASTMRKIFERSQDVHDASIADISAKMTVVGALEVLKKSNSTSPHVAMLADIVQQKKLRQPKGYSGIDGARKLLNDMIYESMLKYDTEIAKCTDYYTKQCAAMEVCRGTIAASNYIAANSRMLILDSQAIISQLEVDIPETKWELKQHNALCKRELYMLNKRLKIVMGDIAVMTMILEMTDCDKKMIQKLTISFCKDKCNKNFVSFDHEGVQHKLSQLQSSLSHDLVASTFEDMFEGVESLQAFEGTQKPVVNKTEFNNPPVPKTEVPGNPCNDPDGGAPSAADKRAAKCTIKKSPQCYKLQERFLLIQAGIQDERDDLLTNIQNLETECEETKLRLEHTIQTDADNLAGAQVKLAVATEKESSAGETARQTAQQHEALDKDLVKQMKTCSSNYINFETELCALKKIRGELFKMKGGGHSAFFQDCEVSKWDAEECNKKCSGGEQKLSRSVLTHPNGGTKCLPLKAMKTCNAMPCPVDCKLHSWSGWSKCSAKCGGGVSQRVRDVKQAMKYDGTPCAETSETKACEGQACEADCELSQWTKWSGCSKNCDGGTKKRQKYVTLPALGDGKCPGQWSKERLEYKQCNMKRCASAPGENILRCNKTLDVVLLLDGSGSLGKRGWAAEIVAAKKFVNAFSGEGARTDMSVILYSGPFTWSGVFKCTGKNGGKIDMEKVCNIKAVTHFESDMKKVDSLISGLTWPMGSTLTSMALMKAKAELSLGRKNAESVVIVITDGRPLSYRKTTVASMQLRKSARLVWVPVTRYAPLGWIKLWATRRWQENVVKVNSFKLLQGDAPVNHIIANICPSKSPKVKFARKRR